MALRLGDKASRILRFLLGLRDGAIAAAMERQGMRQEDVDEGWDLLRALGRRRLGAELPAVAADLVHQIDEWENYWFPILDGVLARHFPAVHAQVFRNLTQGEKEESPVTVTLLLERLDTLRDPTGPFGADGPKALEFLRERRMLTEDVLAVPRGLLKEFKKFSPDRAALRKEEEAREVARAEDAAWAWYIEWSRIARVVIKSRRMLRTLGYLDKKGRTLPFEEEEEASGAMPATSAAGDAPGGMPGGSPFDDTDA